MLEAPRFSEGFAAGDGRPRPHRCGCAPRTPPGASTAEAYLARPTRRCPTHRRAGREFSTAASRAALTYPVPAHGSFFLPGRTPPRSPREEFCEEILDALRWASATTSRRTGAFKLIGIALSGGRDSLLTLLIAHRYASRVRPGRSGLAAARVLHAVAATRRPRPATRRRRSAASWACRWRSCPSTRRSSASWRRPRRCSAGRDGHRADRAEHPGAPPRRSGCGTGPTPRAGSSCRPAT